MAWQGWAVTVRHGAFRLGKFRLGGRGVFRWGGLAFGEAVNFKRRSK